MDPAQNHQPYSLMLAHPGDSVRVAGIAGDSKLVRRMLGLGIRVGSVLEVLNHRNQGIVVGSAGCRVALGSDIADRLLVEPLGS